jgi:hypothetical protein
MWGINRFLAILQMRTIPTIETDSPKEIRLKDKMLWEDEYGMVMEMDKNNGVIGHEVCQHCKYYCRNGCCSLNQFMFECALKIGPYHYYKTHYYK